MCRETNHFAVSKNLKFLLFLQSLYSSILPAGDTKKKTRRLILTENYYVANVILAVLSHAYTQSLQELCEVNIIGMAMF